MELPIEQIDDFIQKETEQQIDEIFREVFLEIKSRTPIVSGKLEAGWDLQENKIKNDVDYAGYVENGTSRMAPAAMVASTLNDLDNIIQRVLINS